MGAESIRDLLRDLDLNAEANFLRDTIKTSKGQKQQRAIKRLKVVNAFIKSENLPRWMILEAVPVIPPELRPTVQLDGGRFADLRPERPLPPRDQRRNNRLKRLLDLGAAGDHRERNEKPHAAGSRRRTVRQLARRGRAVTAPGQAAP